MAKKSNVQKLAEALSGLVDGNSDKSSTWVRLENDKNSIDFIFDGKGNVFESIYISEKVYQVVDEKVIAKFETINHR